jgi:hypothetical protein
MASGSYETSYINTACNLFHHFVVYVLYWHTIENVPLEEAIELVNLHFLQGVIRIKLFGDDVLANHDKLIYSKWSGKFYRDTIKEYCNVTVPESDYVESTKIFITSESLGPVREKGVFTFLKFSFMAFDYDDLPAVVCFVRHDCQSIPKLFTSSDKELTRMTLYQRAICLMWTVGANYRTYYACRRVIKSLGERVIGVMGDYTDMLSRVGLGNDIFQRGPPSYQEVLSFHAYPPINYQPRRIRTIIPWTIIVRYPNLKPYNFTNHGKIEEDLAEETRSRQEACRLKRIAMLAFRAQRRREITGQDLLALPVAVGDA